MVQIRDEARDPAVVSQGEDLEVRIARELLERAKSEGVSLVGPGGLLARVTKMVLQAALDAAMADHLGYDKGDRPPVPAGNHRNGTSPKTVLTEVGPVPLAVPRDRAGKFEPKIVPKHARRVEGFNEAIVSLYARGLTTGEIRAHLGEIYGVEVSRDLVSRVTDKVAEELAWWQSRPLDRVYPVLLIDAIFVKIREGSVANRPVYVVLGINCHGERDVLGLWAGTGGEGAKAWMGILAELRNRGVEDVCIVACDGLKGLPEAITEIWPQATVQLCVVHLVRASLRYASKKYWSQLAKDLRAIYTAPTEAAAEQRFAEFEAAWGRQYPAIIRLWRSSWQQFIPFLAFPPPIRKIVYTTNAIVIWSLDLRVFAVAAGGVLCAFRCLVDALPGQCLRRKPGTNPLVVANFRTKRLLRERCSATCQRRKRPGQVRRRRGGLQITGESLNARFRQATRRRGHFPDEQSAMKVLYLVIRTPQKNRLNVTGGTPGWKEALNTLIMYYGDRITVN